MWLASLGGAIEFYDFVIFVFFAGVIGKLFFAATSPDWIRQFQTFAIFAVGYLARPLGGIVMAHYGDTQGRKRIFTFSIFLMAIPTLGIGLLPTYQSIGVFAPLLLLAMRVLQGMAIGGEAPGAWVFVAEHAEQGSSGYAIGLLTSWLSCGIMLGSVVATLINLFFSSAQIEAGLWRLPFLLGGAFGVGALFLRSRLEETPVFKELKLQSIRASNFPLRTILREHGRAVATSLIATWMLTAVIVVVILMTPALLQKAFNVEPLASQYANLAGTAALALSTAVVGAAADKFGYRRVAGPAVSFLIATSYLLYFGAGIMPSAIVPLYILAGLGSGAVVLVPIAMIDAFPPAVRFTGVSFSYNLAYAIFGGLTPPLVAWLLHLDRHSPAHYIAVVSIVGIVAIVAAPVADPKKA